MLGVKLFILLYLVYIANAYHHRTSLKQLPDETELDDLSPYSDLIKNVQSSAKVLRTRSLVIKPVIKTVAISKRPNVIYVRRPLRYSYKSFHLPTRQNLFKKVCMTFRPKIKPSGTHVIKTTAGLRIIKKREASEPNPDDKPEFEVDPEINGPSDPNTSQPNDNPEPELKDDLKPELDPSESDDELDPKLESEEKYPETPTVNLRSPDTELATETESENIKPESEPQDQPNTSDKNVQCKDNNGYYRIPDSCDSFVECWKSHPKIKTCPDGLLFNSKIKWPRYPCSYPSEVECGNNTNTVVTAPTGECPRRFGSFASSNEDCEKYIVCENGQPKPMTCPMGLGFNPKVGGCDWPANIPNCNPTVFKDFECPKPPRGSHPDRIFNYRYKNSCKLYITCIGGVPRLLRCDSGLSFHDKSSRCISSAAVSNCKRSSELVDTKLFIGSKG